MTKYFVVSGTHDQYLDWKGRNFPEMLINHQVKGISDIIYVSSVEILRGVSNPTGIFIGTWRKRKDLHSILIQLTASMSDPSKHDQLKKVWEYLEHTPLNIGPSTYL